MATYQRNSLVKLQLSVLFVMLTASVIFPDSMMAADVTGTWKAEIETQVGKFKYTYILKQDGAKVTGKIQSELEGEKRESAVIEGKITGDTIEFTEMMNFQGNDMKITYKGKITADGINFTRQVGDFGSETFVAKMEKP
jgi:hypothetical protein